MILSLAFSKSFMLTTRLFIRAANKAASLIKFAKSAPEKPGVPCAIYFTSTSSEVGTFLI